MALKLIAAVALTGFAMLAGRAFAGAQTRVADDMRVVMDDLQMLRVLTLEKLLPMGSALMELRFRALNMAGEVMRKNGNLSLAEAWAQVEARERARGGALEQFTAEDLAEVSALFYALGAMGRKEHEAQYAMTIKRLGKREADARQKGKEKAKLYASLGALAGLALSVMLI